MLRMFKRKAGWIACLAAGMMFSPIAQAAALEPAGWAQTGDAVSIPYGWVDFCQRFKGECSGRLTRPTEIVLSAKAQRDIERVNRHVNKSIQSISDMEHWGVIDQWDYPSDGKGDCEDYALMKRKMLMDMGYPIQTLLMTVVRDLKGEGHAILTVRTDRGDYVLDNLSDEVKGWRATGYKFVKRQSQEDMNTWIAILGPSRVAGR